MKRKRKSEKREPPIVDVVPYKKPAHGNSDYMPGYCEDVLAFGTQGMSKTEMACALGVARSTMYLWAEKHPEFSDALKRAVELSQGYWEQAGRIGMMMGQRFNATAYIFIMKNRFREEYADQHAITHEAGESFKQLWSALSSGAIPA